MRRLIENIIRVLPNFMRALQKIKTTTIISQWNKEIMEKLAKDKIKK